MNIKSREIKGALRAELGSTRTTFHMLLESLSESDLRKRSLNPGWTNGEILAHMTFGFIILNDLLPMARLWGRPPRWASAGSVWSEGHLVTLLCEARRSWPVPAGNRLAFYSWNRKRRAASRCCLGESHRGARQIFHPVA
jgi:hypothetical protein